MLNRKDLFAELINIYEENIISFHTPGHKNGKIFDKLSLNEFKNQISYIDTTEIIGTDNLHNPNGIIKKAQEEAREIFKSQQTYFLVNGSTSGIYSMIMGSTSPGDKVIVDRNCHQSIINAMILGDIIPQFVYPEIDIEQAIPLAISSEEVEKQLIKHPDARAVVITYPNYYGICSDLKKIGEIVHKHNKILLVDEAHGAHLGLSEGLPMTALECGADIVVQSTHKTLPSFTQSSMLHLQGERVDKDRVEFMLRLHQSSSPSYILMASLDLALNIYKNHGKRLMEELLYNIQAFKNKVKSLQGFNIFDKDIIGRNYIKDIDITKIWITMTNNIKGHELEEILREKYNIQMELSNLYGVLALTTIGNDREDFDKLLGALEDISNQSKEKEIMDMSHIHYPKTKSIITPRKALYSKKESVKLEASVGHISGEYIIPYPPGVPLLIPGEFIDENMIRYVKELINKGMEVIGLKDKKRQYIEIIADK